MIKKTFNHVSNNYTHKSTVLFTSMYIVYSMKCINLEFRFKGLCRRNFK